MTVLTVNLLLQPYLEKMIDTTSFRHQVKSLQFT